MTETMKKFRPPFVGDGYAIVDSEGEVFFRVRVGLISEQELDRRRDIAIKALNFYYAKKGEKE